MKSSEIVKGIVDLLNLSKEKEVVELSETKEEVVEEVVELADDKPTEEPKKEEVELTEKEKATLAGEPYIAILKVDLDPSDINNGSFELDWNDAFVASLNKAGYSGRTDEAVVDMWFNDLCRGVIGDNIK